MGDGDSKDADFVADGDDDGEHDCSLGLNDEQDGVSGLGGLSRCPSGRRSRV